ncbi:hypothetical protein RvY_05820 [Ramazzottius varieornatus]|uniref:Uncharacterized protein n=1 Tax=Ramazzottius varieornatus TaxID=947166 RepID=A0A1D1UZD8_RAMVA|nr:hypothetical protein RvY_05820 [Ramazzottius varieornatus]
MIVKQISGNSCADMGRNERQPISFLLILLIPCTPSYPKVYQGKSSKLREVGSPENSHRGRQVYRTKPDGKLRNVGSTLSLVSLSSSYSLLSVSEGFCPTI